MAANLSALEAAMAAHLAPARVLTKAERLRKLATTQRRSGMASIRRLRTDRQWLASLEKINPGVSRFYGVPHSAETRAETAIWALKCRTRANEAAAEARALELAALTKKAA